MKIEVVIKKVISIDYDIDVEELEDDFELLDEITDDAYRIEEEVVSAKELKDCNKEGEENE